ncbi:type II and III secretion system protein family protein [Pseudoalteromonas sp. T1lg76]|uniref:type II and III secretion system protein family protein n=1 Tax=Pseudoalteromonas sp. T1lg76 TaxID=2077103 RepID=UPI000CF6EA45|nr:pilus assembly protein N-terminal domain-containing protein [Pseudoalteromonas sp. T1lg76]
MKASLKTLAVLVLCLYQGVVFATVQTIDMQVGTMDLLPIEKVNRLAIAKPGVISAKVLDDEHVLVIAEGEGNTELQAWDGVGNIIKIQIKVSEFNSDELETRVRALLKGIDGVEVRQVGSLIVLNGKVDEPELEKINTIASSIPNVTSLVSSKVLSMQQMIRMDVDIVELRKRNLKNLGVRWDSSAAGPAFGAISNWTSNDLFSVSSPSVVSNSIVDQLGETLVGSTSFAHFGIVSGLTSQIQLLSEQGDARMLAQPTLSTRSGDKARFLAGGEVPIPLLSANGAANVEFKEYGIKLEIEPVADEQGNIVSFVSAEVSSIDQAVQVNGVPGFKTRETESVVNVSSGDTIVISGLVSSEMAKAVNKVPFLGSIPILGELFKSRDFTDNKTELVILVTPKLVPIEGEDHQNRLKRAQEMISEADNLEAFYILD